MLTIRASAQLIAAAESIDGVACIAAAAGCASPPAPLDADTCRELGLPADLRDVHIAAGAGALRALLLVVPGGDPLRDTLPRLAARLSTRAPHILWLVIVSQPDTRSLAIMAWTDDRRPPRVAALLSDRERVLDSDAETLRALCAAGDERDVLRHARWVEVLGRDALTVRFYRALEGALTTLAQSAQGGSREVRRDLALLHVSRLLFLSFLEAKGWLNGDAAFIAHEFDGCMLRGGRFQERVLRPLFFGTLNTPLQRRAATARSFGDIPFLNGGLFAHTHLERRHRSIVFADAAYGQLLAGVFGQYRFTAREESAGWSEAAVDPEMLGRAFESLMVADERRRTGAFYTPFVLVERVADSGIDAALGPRRTRDALERITVLDPACGSGAFLVHILERVAAELSRLGDERDVGTIRRDVLTRSIYGVDDNPTAVWLCELRLWLTVVIETEASNAARVPPLPNLDRNIRVGDSLSGRAFETERHGGRGGPALRRLRQRYAVSSGPRKISLGRQLDRVEREHAVDVVDRELASIARHRRDLLSAQKGRDLFGERYQASPAEREAAAVLRRRAASLRTQRRRLLAGGALPFSFPVHFADVAARGGFGLVVGNPPWIRLHRISVEQRALFRRDFEVARAAAWEPGVTPAGAGRAFGAQVDVAALFVERAIQLLAPGAALSLLLPVKLWQSLAGGGVRRMLTDETHLRRVQDFSDAPAAFDAAVYPSLVVAERRGGVLPAKRSSCVDVAVHHRGQATLAWDVSSHSLAFDGSPGAPWILLPPQLRRAFDRLRDTGRPLASSPIGRPYLGVKCGCNDAFVVDLIDGDDLLAAVMTRDGRCITVERALLRPLLRGEQLTRWRTPTGTPHIIWTHDSADAPMAELPPYAARWLGKWRRALVSRSDARHRARWWSLFRTESARFDCARVVWADVGREPRAAVIPQGDHTVALNSCYIARCADLTDAHALAALLNGPLARAWLNALAEPARGGYRRYLGWTMSLLPTPADWARTRRCLAPLGQRGAAGDAPTELELFNAALRAFRLDSDDVAALVSWLGE